MALTVSSLRAAIAHVLARMGEAHGRLNELDGQIGDGDLGITLLKAFRELDRIKADLPEDVGQALMTCAGAVAKVSSSSFGTLLATSLMSAAKATKGKTVVEWDELAGLLHGAVAAMAARGKASLGDKTVLDALDAAARACEGGQDPAAMLADARQAIAAALAAFRTRPNKIGRARIFAERTIGMDDPGMVALEEMAGALAA